MSYFVRVDYASDALTTVKKGKLVVELTTMSTGNQSFGYFAGGAIHINQPQHTREVNFNVLIILMMVTILYKEQIFLLHQLLEQQQVIKVLDILVVVEQVLH